MVASSHCSNMVFWVAPRKESIIARCSPSVIESVHTHKLHSDKNKQKESQKQAVS